MNDEELRRAYQRTRIDASPGPHPDPDRLADVVNGASSEADRLATLEHALRCPTCRAELDLLRAANEGARAGKSATFPVRWMTIAAVALLAVGLGTVALRGGRAPAPEVMRGNHAAVAVIAPANGTAAAAPLEFAWHSMSGAQSYRVELLSARGEVISAWTTSDTVLAIPDSVHVSPDTQYDMWVRARLADRTEVSSSLVRFTVKP